MPCLAKAYLIGIRWKILASPCVGVECVPEFWASILNNKSDEEHRSRKLEEQQIDGRGTGVDG